MYNQFKITFDMINNPITKFLIICSILCFIGCDTDVPETDDIAPSFSIFISGDGFSRTFTQDDDLENIQLNLRNGVNYTFLIGGSDQGGVRQVQFQYSPDSTPINANIESPWSESATGITSTIRFNGNVNNAQNAQLIGGEFSTLLGNENAVFDNFYIRVEDFGGESGPPFNVTEGVLNYTIANQETEVTLR